MGRRSLIKPGDEHSIRETGFNVRFHDIRHEATSRFVSAITGQKSLQTVKRYAHLRAEDL
jgi:integrase